MEKIKEKLEVDVNVTYEEYKKIKKEFPYQFWKRFKKVVIVLLVFLFFAISSEQPELLEDFETFVILLIFTYMISKIIEAIIRKQNYKKMLNSEIENIHYTIFFHEDYLEKRNKNTIEKNPYQEIWKIKETETHIYLRLDKENIIPINKSICEEDKIKEIRRILFEHNTKKENQKELEEYMKPPKEYPKMKKFLIALFILTIVSIWIGILLPHQIAKLNLPSHVLEFFPSIELGYNVGHFKYTINVENAPVIDYLWAAWLVLPIPILSIILGVKYKKRKVKCKKNIVVGIIVTLIIVFMGFMAYINPVEQEYKNALDDQKILGVKLPKEGRLFKIKINQTKNPQLIYLLWNNKDDANSIYKEIKENKNWIPKSKVDPDISTSLISKCMSQKEECYYSIYIEETKEYNKLPEKNGLYNVHSMLYDPEISSLKMEKFTDFIRVNN